MANKRQLTGGTDDVNPQYLSFSVTMNAADTTKQATITTPVIRVGANNNGSATIIELLRLYVNMPDFDGPAAALTKESAVFALSTSPPGTTTLAKLSDPKVIAYLANYNQSAFTAGGTGTVAKGKEPAIWDFTDNAGHGVLVATDELYVQVDTSGQANPSSFEVKLLYRFKTVKLVEYIGIVQSQQ